MNLLWHPPHLHFLMDCGSDSSSLSPVKPTPPHICSSPASQPHLLYPPVEHGLQGQIAQSSQLNSPPICATRPSLLSPLASVFPSLQWGHQGRCEYQGDVRTPGKQVAPALEEPTPDDVAPLLPSSQDSPISTQTRNHSHSQHTCMPNSVVPWGPFCASHPLSPLS